MTVVRLLVALVAAALLGLGFAVGALVHVSTNSLWIPVIAALGASLLTAIAGFGIEARPLDDRRLVRIMGVEQHAAECRLVLFTAGMDRTSRGRGPAARRRIGRRDRGSAGQGIDLRQSSPQSSNLAARRSLTRQNRSPI